MPEEETRCCSNGGTQSPAPLPVRAPLCTSPDTSAELEQEAKEICALDQEQRLERVSADFPGSRRTANWTAVSSRSVATPVAVAQACRWGMRAVTSSRAGSIGRAG